MPDTEEDAGTTEETSDSTEENDENSENTNGEEEVEEEPEPDDNWTPHKGKIMQIKPYKYFSDISWDKSYEDPTGTGNITLPYSKDIDDYAFTPEDVKYIYKGVSVKVKVRRSCDEQFACTGLEETGLSELGIREREHIPTEEQKTALGLGDDESDESEEGESEEENSEDEEVEEEIRYSRSSYDDGIYGFISDVSYGEDGAELEIKDWGKALEKDDIKLEFNELHSVIFEEVIKTYGLIPDVDFTGLPNKTLNWSNVTRSGSSSTSSSSGNADLSQLDGIFEAASKFKYGSGGCSDHCPKTAYEKMGENAGAVADCYGMTAWLYYCINFKANIKARDVCGGGSGGSGTHHIVVVQDGNDWKVPSQYSKLERLFRATSSQKSGDYMVCREAPNGDEAPAYKLCSKYGNDSSGSC